MSSLHFSENIVLENERVLLRPLELPDVEHLLHFSLHEPEIWKYSMVQASGRDQLVKYVQQSLDARKAGKEYAFSVFDKSTQQYAGSTRFYDIQLPNKTLQLGYTWYGKDFQGTGLNKHCKFLLLDFAFTELEMERVEFRADHLNARSIAAMKSIGCTVEGILRSSGPTVGGGRRDSIVLSILKHEWMEWLRKELQEKLS
jgi:RimJ/RimL family protein N-acetyltransferase